MGKGDKKTKKGKIFQGSYGVTRKRKPSVSKSASLKKAAEKKEAVKTAAPKKAAKKAAAKKES